MSMKPFACLAAIFFVLAAPVIAAPGKAGKPAPAKPIQISGRALTPDGKPAADATVTFALVEFEKHRALAVQTVKLDADGAFKVMVDLSLIRRAMPIFYATSPTGVAVAQPRGMTLTMILQPFTRVRVRLLDENSKPVANAAVSPAYFSQDRNFGSWDKAVSDRWTAKTDADGYATLADLPQGYETLLNVDDERFAQPDYHSNIALAKAAQTPDQIIHLVRGGSLTGQVLYGPTRKPAANVVIQTMQNGDGSTGQGGAKTDAAGRYKIARLPAGTYTLTLASDPVHPQPWTAAAKTATVSGNAVSSANFTLIHGALLTGIIRDKTTGKPLPNITIMVNGPANPQTARGAGMAFTGPDGCYRLRVPPGSQRVFMAGVGDASPHDFKVADGETKTLNFQIASPAPPVVPRPVAGTVLGPDGKPVAGAEVVATNENTQERKTTTDAQGHFRIDGVPRDKTVIEVQAPENRFASIQVSSGQPNDIIKVSSNAENEAEGKRFEKTLAADATNHGDGTDAHALLQSAQARARSGDKKVLLVFHASWCGPCFLLHRFLIDPQIKPIMDAHFVVLDLDIWERGKNKWENPGGVDLYKQYGGPNSVPFFVVTDDAGKKLGDAMHNRENMGMPSQPDDVQFFLNTLQTAAPSLTGAELATLKAGLQRHASL